MMRYRSMSDPLRARLQPRSSAQTAIAPAPSTRIDNSRDTSVASGTSATAQILREEGEQSAVDFLPVFLIVGAVPFLTEGDELDLLARFLERIAHARRVRIVGAPVLLSVHEEHRDLDALGVVDG